MWLVLTSACSLVTLITTIMLCLCWRKKTQKNDLLGLDGLVTQKNPDENVNHLPSAIAQSVPDGIVNAPIETANDASKSKPVVVNNPRRSLPDIPLDGVRSDGDVVTYEPNGDNSSDLYATVEPYHNTLKRHTLPNGIETHTSISQHSSISQADDTFSPYARVKEHPYNKLRKTEHPYARIQPSSSQEQEENSSGEGTPRNATIRNERISTSQIASELVQSRSRRSSGQSGVGSDILAASAVSGGIAANQELPYMTPPIVQTNFSGDSQDSSKGYTSISVREPLANIRAQTKALSKGAGDLDPHYSTVSDDSDDVYTTIQDPNNPVYTSGSETYAQIQPVQLTISAEVNTEAPVLEDSNKEEDESTDQLYEPAPQPPSVDSLKHVTHHNHSRQASSSSSVGNLGSPKPEKRQANSPLPPPPTVDNAEKLLVAKNLDDMYAKVHKGRKKIDKHEEPDKTTTVLKDNETIQSTSTFSLTSVDERNKNNEPVTSNIRETDFYLEHNYETLRKSIKNISDPGYEKLRPKCNEVSSEPGYDTINGPDSILSSDPDYEVLKHHSEVSSELDPNYEELRERTSSVSGSTSNRLSVLNNLENNGYSVVNKLSKNNSSSEEAKSKNSSSYESDARDLSLDEPNYESMPSESLSEHNYALLKSTGSESDPNYESVSSSDPNYESVKYLDVSLEEPPYERLQDEDSSKTDSNRSCYEKTQSDSLALEKQETKIEKLSTKEVLEQSGNCTDPGYETIQKDKTIINNSNNNTQMENELDGIVQV